MNWAVKIVIYISASSFMKQTKGIMSLNFSKAGHFWLDSGLVGLKKILDEMEKEVVIKQEGNELVLEGSKNAIQSLCCSSFK